VRLRGQGLSGGLVCVRRGGEGGLDVLLSHAKLLPLDGDWSSLDLLDPGYGRHRDRVRLGCRDLEGDRGLSDPFVSDVLNCW